MGADGAGGRSSGFCVDPVEKKPPNHFLPGTSVLSFGTASCNLSCRFCPNWDISKSREIDTLADAASPERIAEAASALGCSSGRPRRDARAARSRRRPCAVYAGYPRASVRMEIVRQELDERVRD